MKRVRSTSASAGFTLPEVLLAAAIITIAFVGLLTVIPYSTSAVQSGNQTSTATFLANQKLEEAKNMPWASTPANDCLGISATATSAPTVPAGQTCTLGATVIAANGALPWAADQGATAIAGFNGYSRNVRVTNCATTACAGITDAGMRLVTVSVTYNPAQGSGTSGVARTIRVSMVIAQR